MGLIRVGAPRRPLNKRLRSTVFLLPAWFAPWSGARRFFHVLRGANLDRGCEIGYHVLIDNLYPERVKVEHGATIVAGSQLLAHDLSRTYTRGEPVRRAPVVIHHHAFVGAGAIILPGITIGARAVVGAGAVVTKDVPADCTVAGNPARPI